MKSSSDTLEAFLTEHRALSKEFKKLDDAIETYRKKLTRQVQLLIAQKLVTLDTPVEDLGFHQLEALVKKHESSLDCQVFRLEDLRANHNCQACKTNPDTTVGAKPTHVDGSETPTIPGLFPSGPVTLESVEEHNFRYITGGTTCGIVNAPGIKGGDQLALFIWYPDFHSETPERCARLQRLAYLIWLGKTYATPCTRNGPHQAVPPNLRGSMSVAGQRKDLNTRIPWAKYAMPKRFKRRGRQGWVDFQEEYLPEIGTIMNMFLLESAAKIVVKKTHQLMGNCNLPPLEATTINKKDWNPSLGCNITFSFNRFSNACHFDKDEHCYVYSAYVFVDSQTGELITDTARISNYMKGGFLIWPDLHLALKIIDCTGVVFLFWRGTHERHCTITSEILDNSIIRIGTSIQVNKRLFTSVKRYYDQLYLIEKWEVEGGVGPSPQPPVLPQGLGSFGVGDEA
ncbi:hypothetical protein RhiJN_26316 [Ceratobasidium sp. AG-Ba]|nr:hypothetical protein RhiJN_26316 [Ceratobasidium sp. AG-Ba]